MKRFLWSHLPAFLVCCLPGPPARIPLSSFSFCAWRPPVKSAGCEVEVMGIDPWSSLDWGPRWGEAGDSAGALKQTKLSQKETSYTKEKIGLKCQRSKLTSMLHHFPEEISSAVDLQLFQGSEKRIRRVSEVRFRHRTVNKHGHNLNRCFQIPSNTVKWCFSGFLQRYKRQQKYFRMMRWAVVLYYCWARPDRWEAAFAILQVLSGNITNTHKFLLTSWGLRKSSTAHVSATTSSDWRFMLSGTRQHLSVSFRNKHILLIHGFVTSQEYLYFLMLHLDDKQIFTPILLENIVAKGHMC